MSNDIHELSDAEIIRQAQRSEFDKNFPEFERVAAGEAVILKKGDTCVKLYKPEYTHEVIEKYARVTNGLAAKLTGSTLLVDIPDGSHFEFTLNIVSVDKVDKVDDGRSYSVCKFAEGGSLQTLHQASQQTGVSFKDEFMEQLRLNGRDLIAEMCNRLESTLKEQTAESDQDAVKIHPDNFKIAKSGDKYILTVTDISCALRIISSQK